MNKVRVCRQARVFKALRSSNVIHFARNQIGHACWTTFIRFSAGGLAGKPSCRAARQTILLRADNTQSRDISWFKLRGQCDWFLK